MSELVHGAVVIMANVAALTSIAMWIWALRRNWNSQSRFLESLVAVRPREKPFWTLADAMVMFGSHLTLLAIIHQSLVSLGWIAAAGDTAPAISATDRQLANVVTVVSAGLGSSLVVLAWLRLMQTRPISRLSLVFNSRDAWLGLQASVMLLPPVLLISALVNSVWPYQHQVLDLLQNVDSISVFLGMFVATAVVTPFVEEFLFRVLIQGSIQGMIDHAASESRPWIPRSLVPMLIASVLFALMHLGQGAAPIPLFFLSLGLGYLYRQTGNITAPLVVHMVLNGFTLIAKFTEAAAPL